ncbi:hypothetical protein AX14_006736 [Amanita brunnescens Koide BX004]|nr:hypothetical protein AX14_006736 [Amanita brunnescens Koide BX004]
MAYDSLADDPRLTSLVVTPRADGSQFDFSKLNAQVHIIPFISMTSPIPLHRLSPSHSNVRIKSSSALDDAATSPPTPIYNTHFMQCLTPKIHLVSTYALKQDSPAFSDALALLRIWANQGGYGEGSRLCVHGFKGKGSWWSALLDLLVRGEEPTIAAGPKSSTRRALGRGLSSYQMFRAALDVLAKFDPGKDAVFVKAEDGHRFLPEDYRAHHSATFVDSSSLVNFVADIPPGSLEMLSYDARKTLETLDDPAFPGDPFTHVFLKEQRDIPTRFDLVLRVGLSKAEPSTQSALDHGSPFSALIFSIDSMLHQALGNRSKVITILHPSSTPRAIAQAHLSIPNTIFIGILHDPSHAFRLVEHGPSADEDPSAINAFRELWGDKAELRRFKDGRILQSVVWDVKTAEEKTHVPAMIVQHVLHHHFGLATEAVTTWQSGYDAVLRMSPAVSKVVVDSGVPVGFKAALDAFDGIVKAIKGLDDELPLALVQASPVSEMLRYTSVFGPVALASSVAASLPPNGRYMPAMEMILQFERSSRWPDDLKAIQKMKLAFFEHLATRLMGSIKGLSAAVVLGDGTNDSEIADRAWLDIVTPEGWAFSARIWHNREAVLLDRALDASSKTRKMPHITVKKDENKNGREYQEALEAQETYTRRFIHAPRHHRAIAALYHSHSAFAGTVRLVKRWFGSHWLLRGHVSEEVVELLCASFFALGKPESGRIPGSKERGFALVVEFLKEWKWEEGLFVPLYAGDSSEEVSSPSSKRVHGSGVWRVKTDMDIEGRVWTGRGPDVVVANRVKALAKATWDCMAQIETGVFDVKTLFVHPTDDYDFIIKLDRSVVPRYFQNVTADPKLLARRGKYANLASSSSQDPVRPGFDPVQLFFQDLQRIYADTFRLFYDVYGGDEFGGVWDPSVKQAREFRVLGGFSGVPVNKGVELNESGVLAEIERLGAGLVTAIVVTV